MILLYVDGNLDMTWYDTYHFFLFTRGGPYWQDVKVIVLVKRVRTLGE